MSNEQSPNNDRLETARSNNTISSASYKTIRVFTRKPNENDGRTANRTKRVRGSGDDFASFYSPTRPQYEQVQKGRIDINTVFNRPNLSPRAENAEALRSEKNLETTDSLTNTSPIRQQIKLKTKLAEHHNKDSGESTQATDVSQFTSRDLQTEPSQGNRFQQLQSAVASLTAENRLLRVELESLRESRHLTKAVSNPNLTNLLGNIDGFRPEKPSMNSTVGERASRNQFWRDQSNFENDSVPETPIKKYADECERRAKAETNLRSALQKILSLEETVQFQLNELTRKEGVIAELAELLSATRLELEVESKKVSCLEELTEQHREDILKYRQINKYLEAELHVLRHKRHNALGAKLPAEQRGRLMEINQKLRDEATRLRRSHRERSTELFQLSPDKAEFSSY